MKKNLIVAIIASMSALASCTQEDMPTQPQPETVTFSIKADSKATTRAIAPTVAGKDTRYIVELWNEAKTTRIGRYVQLNNPSFSLILDKALSYNVAVWVDYVTDVDDSTPTPADYFYVTTDFQRIVLNSLDGDPDAFDGRIYKMSNLASRDAFTGIFTFTAGQPYPTTLQVKRPLARINVIAKDASVWKSQPEINGDSITVRITNPGYYTFNALTQTCVATGIDVEFTNTIYASTYNNYPSGESQTVLSGLYFAQTDENTNLTNTQNFSIHWKVGQGTETNINLTALPFKRNYNTNISGGLIFNVANFSIDTNSTYDTPDFSSGF